MVWKTIHFVPILLLTALSLVYAAPGQLDTRFNSPNGFAVYDSGFSDGMESIALQEDGKIVVVGWIDYPGTNWDVTILRYNADGRLDTTFGTNGVITERVNTSSRGRAIAIQPDRKVLMAGETCRDVPELADECDALLVRYNHDGTRDNDFGTNGVVTYNHSYWDAVYGIALQPDGKIVVGGLSADESLTSSEALLLRFKMDGTPDPTFGTNGMVVYSQGINDEIISVAVQPDGKILAGGHTLNGPSDVLLLRYNPNGTLDTGFGAGGVVKYDGGSADYARKIALQADGKILVAGWTHEGIDDNVLLLRYNSDGTLDSLFGTNGVVRYDSRKYEQGWSMAVQPNGKVLVTGRVEDTDHSDVLLLRYAKDGALDASFGQGGVVRYDSGLKDGAQSVAIASDGGIVVGAWFLDGSEYDLRVLKFKGGELDRPIPDTGQAKCYNNTDEIPCPQPGEPFYGQDGNYAINTPSYTKLDSNRNDLPDDATEWVMVRDNLTGLIWEMKNNMDSIQDYSNLHDADNTYSWYDSNPATNGGYAGTPGDGTDTEDFVNALNAANFGGYGDWRLPTRKELRNLEDYGRSWPSININYFPNTVASGYWSSTTDVYNTYWASGMFFSFYYDFHCDKSYPVYVRAVRGGQTANQFINNSDGTVTDMTTGLMWQQATAPVEYPWEQALSYCENLTLGGYADWRLPTIKELESIVDLTRVNPAINTTFFPDTNGAWYWSSTASFQDFSGSECIDFSNGGGGYSQRTISQYVRAVRRGQAAALGDLNGDGSINLTDAILGLRITAGFKSPDINVRANVNGDGKIGMTDVVYILQKTAGLR